MSIFGQTIAGIHLGLLIVNAATVALVFFLGRRLIDETTGIAAAASYAILSVSPTVLGFAGHATHFVVLAAVGGALLLLSASDRQSHVRSFLSGVLFGLGLIMKQPGAAFVAFGLGYLLFHSWKTRCGWRATIIRNGVFVCGAVLPFALTCFILWRAGVFERFWFWAIEYARVYGSRISLPRGAQNLAANIGLVIGSSVALWLLAAVGLAISIWKIRSGMGQIFLLGLLFFSALAVSAGLYFRDHYFILALPAISLLAGATISALHEMKRLRVLSVIVFFFALSLPLLVERDFFFSRLMEAASRQAYGLNPFPESVRIAKFLRDRTEPNETIAVLGSEPEIYFYSHRHSATGYIYTYALMEHHKYAVQMQREMIQEIEFARPKYLVFVAVGKSWLVWSSADKHIILAWVDEYCGENYEAVGLVNISEQGSDYYFSESPLNVGMVERVARSSRDFILIYKRKA